MAPYTKPDMSQAEPVPAEFDAQLQAIDARLAEQASRSVAPPGLAQRVYEASASLLPEAGSRTDYRIWMHLTAGSLVVRHLTRSRLAMAASLAMAFGVAVWFLQAPTPPSSTAGEIELASALQSLAADTTDTLDDDFVYLLVTNDLTSAEDITDTLEQEL